MSRLSPIAALKARNMHVALPDSIDNEFIQRGTRRYLHATLALFSAGLSTFALLYCVQPLLPLLSEEFSVSPASGSLALSISTGMLALGLLITGPLSDAVGRKSVMVTALLLAAIFTLFSASMPSWHGMLFMRALTGLALSGVAAVGMRLRSKKV